MPHWREMASTAVVTLEGVLRCCSKCGISKPSSEFNKKYHRNKTSLRHDCKDCQYKRFRDWRRNNPDKAKKDDRRRRFSAHHTTEEEINQLITQQNGCCYRCGVNLSDKFCIDHDHNCCDRAYSCGNCIRGVACTACNIADGLFAGDVGRIKNFYESYLGSSCHQQQ